MPRSIVLLIATITLLGIATCSPEPAEQIGPAPALSGLGALEVRVFRIQSPEVRSAVPEESLKVDVERRLAAEGIAFLGSDDEVRAPGRPQLWVLFKAIPVGSGSAHACALDLYLVQSVRLGRYPERTIRAITWNSRSQIGTVPELSLAEARRSLDPAFAELVAAFRSANP